jgi:hypothetical protein
LGGTTCKELRKNMFLFTFSQASGKRRALEEGPWLAGKELLILEDFVINKTLDEYKFCFFPIWVRVSKLPLGLMDRENGEKIGRSLGEFLEVGVDADGSAVGEYLRIKVRLDVREPLRRRIGTSVNVEEGDEEPAVEEGDEDGDGTEEIDEYGQRKRLRWCPISYEHLPNFCFTCGLIGHIDNECAIKLKPGEHPLYSRELKAYMPSMNKRYVDDDRGKWMGSRGGGPWRSNSSGGRASWSRSDSDSWRRRKGDDNSQPWGRKSVDDREVTSPLKIPADQSTKSAFPNSKKQLFVGGEERDQVDKEMEVALAGGGSELGPCEVPPQLSFRVISDEDQVQDTTAIKIALQVPTVEFARQGTTKQLKTPLHFEGGTTSMVISTKTKQRSYKKVKKPRTGGTGMSTKNNVGSKRELEAMDCNDDMVLGQYMKKLKGVGAHQEHNLSTDAGLRSQPCKDQ